MAEPTKSQPKAKSSEKCPKLKSDWQKRAEQKVAIIVDASYPH